MLTFLLLVSLAATQGTPVLQSPIHDENGPVKDLYQVDDMIFTAKEYREEVLGVTNSREKRQWTFKNLRTWSQNGNVVPYRFAEGFDEEWKHLVARAVDEWQRKTCITFRPAVASETYVIEFFHGTGCNSPVGMHSLNRISLEYPGCGTHSVILREIGHSLGMGNEHQHPEQERYLSVQYQNIEERLRQRYRPISATSVETHGTSYDPYSIMHYEAGPTDRPSMVMKDRTLQNVVGRQTSLSVGDANFIRITHGCSGHSGFSCPEDFGYYPDGSDGCTGFYQCVWRKASHFDCPCDTLVRNNAAVCQNQQRFDPNLNVCNHAENVPCVTAERKKETGKEEKEIGKEKKETGQGKTQN
ncbi:unnamed protein product [Owenia fusiformis]|uniref:Metalloendopeptidase n=1 Tax=Owenia fusiformis TaxID=6347 RepID=A0A8J1TRL9_OWEFU|nr:unnamed protein product [Owenia fusiformis]